MKKKATNFVKKKLGLRKSKPKMKQATSAPPPTPPVPMNVDRADVTSYQISSVVKDSKNRITYVKIGDNLYDIATVYRLHKESGYTFFTSDDGVIKRDVLLVNRKGGKYYFATQADWKKENNLDYLPRARLD